MPEFRTYTVKLTPIEGGGYCVFVPALPGCVTEGHSFEHALDMAKEAIEGYLAVLIEDGDPIPEEPARSEPILVGVHVAMPAVR